MANRQTSTNPYAVLSHPRCHFPPHIPVRTLFATNFYEADIGSPELLEELEESSRLFAEEDGAGRAWSREHGYKGYTSYASLGDLPERDPAFHDLKRLPDKQVKTFELGRASGRERGG